MAGVALVPRPAETPPAGAANPPRRGRRRRAAATRGVRIAAVAAVSIFLVLFGALFHWVFDFTRGTPLNAIRVATPMDPPAIRDAGFVDMLAAVAEAPFRDGHRIEVLVTPRESFARIFADLRAATRSINIQSYYCLPGAIADSTVAILAERARAGVHVMFLADGYGCRDFTRHYGTALRHAGAELAVLRPVRWYALHRAQHRSHVRLVIVDGTTAYTGGFGLDDKWADDAHGRRGWRETNVRFTGPAVRQAQGAFVIAWAEATRELVAARDFFPLDGGATTGARAALQFAGPGLDTTPFERLLFLTLAGASERLYIANSYFVPNAALRALLAAAAARGVDVRVLTAGSRSDVPSTLFAARASYGELLDAGVRIYEYQATMMHAKTLVADGQLSLIGSMNFDNRSLRLNDEANLLVYDRGTAHELERIFADDLRQAVEITRETHARRPLRQRLFEQVAKLVAPLL